MKLSHVYFHAMRKILAKLSDGKTTARTIFGNRINSIEKGGDIIRKYIDSEYPVMIARIGTVEMQAINAVINMQNGLIPTVSDAHRFTLCNNAGFFPNDIDAIIKFAKVYKAAASNLDVAAIFPHHDDDYFYYKYSNAKEYIALNSLEPYYALTPWSRSLAGKKVLVVHPFSSTIAKQYVKREHLFENDLLPDFELLTLKAVQTIGNNTGGFNTWFDALEYMKSEMSKIDFDIAILGCGAYAFPLAAHAKSLGKKSIVMGGATQILFGIKGKRWDNHPKISKLYNEFWIRPSKEEIPNDNEKVENGCYW